MAREKTLIGYCGMDALYDCTETFTHRLTLPSGVVLRGDPANNFWGSWSDTGNAAWYGACPSQWDNSLAVEEVFSRNYEMEVDVS